MVSATPAQVRNAVLGF